MTAPFGHHELHSRHRFRATLELETPLRLSSGRASPATDAPLMRDRAGRPFVPGSSLRGALRSQVERILAAVGSAAGLRSCTLFTEDDGDDACPTVSRPKQDHILEIEREEGDDAALLYLEDHLCDLCKLFGSPVYASRLVIEDVYPTDQGDLRDRLLVRDGVGIDRDTGRAAENVKFDFEVLDPGSNPLELALRMEVENLTATDRKLLQAVFGLLQEGLAVGGKRSAGLGRLRLDPKSLTVTGFESPEELWSALTTGSDPHRELSWQGGA